jgi:sulfur-oxidizing protein SoxZ
MAIVKDSSRNMRMSAKLKDDVTEVKMVINHPMETGRKKDDFGQLIPAHFIRNLVVQLNGKPVFEAQFGTGIAKNPYLTFRIKGAKLGDKLETNWLDNLGETGVGEVIVAAA